MAVPALDRIGMLVVHAFVDRGTNELRASVTFAGDLADGTEITQIATSADEIVALVRTWLAATELGNGGGDGRVTDARDDRDGS
jgi:hypothetical protein